MGKPDLVAGGGRGRGRSPGSGRVDGLAVGVEPGTEFAEWSLLEVGDVAGAVRADVDEQVAAVGDDVGEQVDELGAGEGVGGGLLGVVAEGAAQAPAQLPGPRGRRVGDGVLVGLDVVVEGGGRWGSGRPTRANALRDREMNRRYRARARRFVGIWAWVQRSLTTPSATVS